MFTEKETDRVNHELWEVIDGRKNGSMDAQTAADITNACGKLIKNFALQFLVQTSTVNTSKRLKEAPVTSNRH